MYDMYAMISRTVDQITERLIGIRRHLHSHPELGYVEFETSQYLKNILSAETKLDFHSVGKTGFCADLVTDKKKPWMAIRADMDALPIPDEKKVPYKSIHAGLSHACGHDYHSTVALGVALVLHKLRNKLTGNVRFIFQHAEEPIPGGAIDFVKAGYLDNIDSILGMHVDPAMPLGKVGLTSGWISAQSIHFRLSINGPGGHSARPNEAPDPVFTGLSVLNGLYAELYRKLNSARPFVFTVGKIAGGESYNSIAQHFTAEGTLRVTDSEQGDALLNLIEQKFATTCEQAGLITGFDYKKGAKPVINDVKLTENARVFLQRILSPDQLVEARRSMGGDDFSAFLERAPGVFLIIGVGNGKSSAPIHSSLFDIDERAIAFGVKVFSWLLVQYLGNE